MFQYICQKTQIYTQLVEFTFKHIVSKSMQKSIQQRSFPSHLSKVFYPFYFTSKQTHPKGEKIEKVCWDKKSKWHI